MQIEMKMKLKTTLLLGEVGEKIGSQRVWRWIISAGMGLLDPSRASDPLEGHLRSYRRNRPASKSMSFCYQWDDRYH